MDPDNFKAAHRSSSSSAVHRALQMIQSDDPDCKLQAAREIRRLTKTSQRCRRQLAEAVKPLVSMLRVGSSESQSQHEAALLALLNLAVKDEKYVTNSHFINSLRFHHFFNTLFCYLRNKINKNSYIFVLGFINFSL